MTSTAPAEDVIPLPIGYLKTKPKPSCCGWEVRMNHYFTADVDFPLIYFLPHPSPLWKRVNRNLGSWNLQETACGGFKQVKVCLPLCPLVAEEQEQWTYFHQGSDFAREVNVDFYISIGPRHPRSLCSHFSHWGKKNLSCLCCFAESVVFSTLFVWMSRVSLWNFY